MPDKKTVLLIDDEEDLVEMIEFQLKAKDYKVLKAYNGKEGLAVLEKQEPDLIVLDVNMPEMGGIEFLTKITGDGANPIYPVLVLTARANLESTFKDINVAGFMPKPFEIDNLLEEIEHIIKTNQEPEKSEKTKHTDNKRLIFLVDFLSSAHTKDIKSALVSAGYEVKIVEDYDTMHKKACKTRPSLILMEYMQKGISGYDFIKKIKKEPEDLLEKTWPAIFKLPVVVYSYSGFDYKEKSLKAGASKYIGKPESPENIPGLIEEFVADK